MSTQRQSVPLSMRFGKWSGALLGGIAWFADQQIIATTAFANCPAYSRELAVAVGAGCGLVALLGGLHSWHVRRTLSEDDPSSTARTDRFIATISLLLAVISILAIVFGTTAGVIFRCER
jgi:nitrate reductase gamma subunit